MLILLYVVIFAGLGFILFYFIYYRKSDLAKISTSINVYNVFIIMKTSPKSLI